MATEIDELIVQISADTRQLRTELDRVRRQTENAFPSGNNSPVGRFKDQIRGLIGPLVAVGGAMAAFQTVKGIAATGDEFEALGITLNRLYGSAEGGEKAFADIREFAETTPFQLEDVTKAFIQLQSNGIEPNTQMLTIFGDAASAALNPLEAFNALIRITQRAAGGGLGLEELEQLVNQGIPVYKILSEEINRNRDEITELGKSAEGAAIIMDALQKGLDKRFGGIMAQRMDLLSTKTSNMEIAFKNLQTALFEGGLGNMLKGLADDMQGFLNQITASIRASRQVAALNEDMPSRVMAALRAESLRERNAVGHAGRQARASETVEQAIERVSAALLEERERLKDVGKITDDMDAREERSARQAAARAAERLAEIDKEIAAIERLSAARIAANAPPTPETGGEDGAGTGTGSGSSTLTADQIAVRDELNDLLDDTITKQGEINRLTGLMAQATELGFNPEQVAAMNALLTQMQDELDEEGLKGKFGDLQKAIQTTVTPAEELEQKIAEIKALMDAGDSEVLGFIFGDATADEIDAILTRLGVQLENLKNKTDETAATFAETMAPAIASMAHSFTTDFVSALTSGQDALRAFNDFARNMVNQIIATFLQMAVVNKIINGVFAGVGGFTPLPEIDVFGERASGGSVGRMKPYLVGERGPELFIPAVAGTIKNAADTRSMSSGGAPIVVNQNLSFSTGVVPTVRAEIAKMLPQISDATKTSVLEATRRGGNYRRGLLGG